MRQSAAYVTKKTKTMSWNMLKVSGQLEEMVKSSYNSYAIVDNDQNSLSLSVQKFYYTFNSWQILM